MDRFQEMLADLRSTFNKKIPGGLDDSADARLQKTLTHYVGEVGRVKTSPSVMEILSLTYESMAKWYRKTLTSSEEFTSEVDPDTLFASLKMKKPEKQERSERSEKPDAIPNGAADLQKISELPRVVPAPYVQQKDVLQPQEDVVKYREVEYNLVMNSKDRDWLASTTQNRYNFVIQFNTNYRPQGYGLQGSIRTRLRNIVRIEFVKAILPVEGLDVTIPANDPARAFYSVLAMPSVNILAEEFDGNNFGTNNTVDKSLAVCQYDATWRPDHFSDRRANRGYAVFIPKFMKAQRVYVPTPLSNLQTLSFRIQDAQDNLLSSIPDSAPLARVVLGNSLSGLSTYLDPSGTFVFVRTTEWFPIWSFSQLDKILFQGLGFMSGSQPAGGTTLVDWLQQSGGHMIVGCAYDGSGGVTDGCNTVGYSNWIIIQNRFLDPQTGSTDLNYFTGSEATEAQLATDLLDYPQQGGILNLSRQVQLTVRIITREYDLMSNIRPDNV